MSYNSANDKVDAIITKEEWTARLRGVEIKSLDMNKLVMNYLVNEGFKEAAEKFSAEAGVEPCVKLNTLEHRILIRDAIQNGRVQEAKSLVNKFHPELLDNDRYLHFHLQQLHLIELIRAGNVDEALEFAQTQMSEAHDSRPEALSELERTLALLAFDKPQNSPFSDLLEHSYRQKIASELNAAILKREYKEHKNPQIVNLLKVMMWAQCELEKRGNCQFPKMDDIAAGTLRLDGPSKSDDK